MAATPNKSNAVFKSRHWLVIRDYIIGWVIAFFFIGIVRGVGTQELGALRFDFWSTFFITLSMAPLLGLITGYLQVMLEERFYKRISLLRFLLYRLLYMVGLIIFIFVLAFAVYSALFGLEVSFYAFVIEDAGSRVIYFYVLVVDFMLSLLRQINLMLGQGNLWRLLKGQFYTPKVAKKVFMFLDLQSSTTIAEQIGHIRYSQLIQDCLYDLGVVGNYKAEIYQYVGDEAVLTWPAEAGISNQNCLRAFYAFKHTLTQKADYYQQKYQWVPFFKAGVHVGEVTVTEVGKYKREIAYHGDTINTAARIQGPCNALEQDLLLSAQLADALSSADGPYQFSPIGSVPLKGKQQPVTICTVAAAGNQGNS